MWAPCWVGQRPWWQKTWKRLKYSMSLWPQCLLVRLAFRNPRPLRPERKSTSAVEDYQVREHLNKLDIMGLHEHSWDAPTGAGDAGWCHCKAALDSLWKITVITVTERFLKDKKENLGRYRPVCLISAPGKVTEQLNSETISGHVKDQKVWLGVITMDLQRQNGA